jgi:hypothetical protein
MVLVDGEQLRAPRHLCHQRAGIIEGVAEGLLADDVNPCLLRKQAMLPVQPRHREDVDEVQPFGSQHTAEIVVHARFGSESVAARLGPRNRPVSECDDLHLRNPLPPPQVKLRDHPAAKYAATQLCHTGPSYPDPDARHGLPGQPPGRGPSPGRIRGM